RRVDSRDQRHRLCPFQVCGEGSQTALNTPYWRHSATPQRSISAGAEQVLGRELLQAHEAEALAAEVGARVEVLPRRAVGHEVGDGLAAVERRLAELAHLGGLEGL